MYRPALIAGAFFGALSVILGAFGAHGLQDLVQKMQLPDGDHILETYRTGATYNMYGAFLLLFTGLAHSLRPGSLLRAATWTTIIGVLLFSGSLYAITAAKVHGGPGIIPIAGPLTPIGGLFFIVTWIILLIAFLKKK